MKPQIRAAFPTSTPHGSLAERNGSRRPLGPPIGHSEDPYHAEQRRVQPTDTRGETTEARPSGPPHTTQLALGLCWV